MLFVSGVSILAAHPQDEVKTGAQLRAEFNRNMASLRKDPKQLAEFTEMIQRGLAGLGYGTTFTGRMDERTIQAVREYQRYSGLAVTGTLTFETFQRLLADGKVLKSTLVPLPPAEISLEEWDKGFVSASGTWVNDGDTEPTMPQVSQIKCYRDAGICIESMAIMFIGLLKADTDVETIERWDNTEIVTKPVEATCTRNITRFNRAQTQVTSLRSTISTDPSCAAIQKDELHSVLKSGSDIYLKELVTENALREKAMRTGASAVGLSK